MDKRPDSLSLVPALVPALFSRFDKKKDLSSRFLTNFCFYLKVSGALHVEVLSQELSEKLHTRGLGLGQGIYIDTGNIVATKYNITEVAGIVDWFYVSPFQQTFEGFIEPVTPLQFHRGETKGSLVSFSRLGTVEKKRMKFPPLVIRL